jgi:hypothetical protein
MIRWMIPAASILLAGCSGPPRAVLTSADPHSIQFFVQSARFVPLQEVEDRATRHCADYGLVPRRTQAEWVSDSSMTFRFECEELPKPTPEKVADKKLPEPPVAPPKAPVVRSAADRAADRKQAAWDQANAMSSGWVKCIADGATRMARASNEGAAVAAVGVATGCSQWEHDIHGVLQKAGEDDGEFQADLHREIIEFATARITSVRASVPLAAH